MWEWGERFVGLLQRLYEGGQYTFQWGEEEIGGVECRKGVRQGCPMSPILFAVMLGELETRIRNRCGHRGFKLNDFGKEGVEWRIPGLFLADDIVLFEEEDIGMQE